jgi:hypothetical protein
MTKFSKIAIAMVTMVGMAGVAMAGDPKAPAPAPKADPKADAAKTPAPAPADAKAAPKMEMPKPAPEIAEMAKGKTGTWKCDGTTMGMDMKEAKFKGTMKSKSDLDGFWIHDSFEGTAGEGKTAMKFKMEAFTTFDAASKKWHSMSVMNDGGHMMGTSDGVKDNKMETVSDTMGPMGSGQFKDHADMSDAKKGVHMWGEMTMDKGKTWNKVYDMMCKK